MMKSLDDVPMQCPLLSRDFMLGQQLPGQRDSVAVKKETHHIGDPVRDLVDVSTPSTCHVALFNVHLSVSLDTTRSRSAYLHENMM
jgi:hypothetical protein